MQKWCSRNSKQLGGAEVQEVMRDEPNKPDRNRDTRAVHRRLEHLECAEGCWELCKIEGRK